MSYRKSAIYVKQLAEVASKIRLIEMRLTQELSNLEFEASRCEDLSRAYSIIETAAKKGHIRLFKNEQNKFIFNDDISSYLRRQGFSISYDKIEWYDVEDELK